MMHTWVDEQKTCLVAERNEEVRRCPVAVGISYDSYKGPQAFVNSLQTATRAPLRLLQAAGYAIKGLTVLQTQISATSKTPVVLLGRQNQLLSAETSGLRSRDIVVVLDGKLRLVSQGIVVSLTEKSIGVSIEEAVDVADLEAAEPLVVLRVGSDLTFKYLTANLEHFKTQSMPWAKGKPILSDISRIRQQITDVLLGERELLPFTVPSSLKGSKLTIPPLFRLNAKQLEAVTCINTPHFLNVLWGPAGTGKTTTLSAAVALYLAGNPQARVLICGPSNTATDNLLLGVCAALKKLGASTGFLLRLGSPARTTSEAVYPFLFDTQLLVHHSSELSSAKTDFQKAEQTYRRMRTKSKSSGDKKALYEAKSAFFAARENMFASQRECGKSVLAAARLVACTLSGASTSLCLRTAETSNGFDLVLVDEASQALDASLLAAVLLTKGKLVLAGDPNQLPPTILSDSALHSKAFSVPFINRVTSSAMQKEVAQDGLQVNPFVMLEQQYRFNGQICRFPSKEFYHEKLTPDESVRNISLADFLGDSWFNLLGDDGSKNPTELFFDTCGQNLLEECEDDGNSVLPQLSILNRGEADIVAKLVRYLVSLLSKSSKAPNPEGMIGCITPYAAQVSLLVSCLEEHVARGLEVSTVDGFQGREKEIIIISFVRSNDKREVGFLSDRRRLNVSITRAKRLLVIIGNSLTLENDATLKAYCDHLMNNATILFPEDLDSWETGNVE